MLIERGYDACEIDFSDGFWMDRDYAQRLGSLAKDAGMALSIHAPLAAFLGHVQQGGRKHQMAVGMLDHTAGLAAACGAAPVVIHPGFLLGRSRDDALTAVMAQLTELRQRLAAKGRAVDFGVGVLGRVQEDGKVEGQVGRLDRLVWLVLVTLL